MVLWLMSSSSSALVGQDIRLWQIGRDLMLCSVAQLPGQLNKGYRMAEFQTIIYLLGLLV